jgi:hypothetical protein
VVRCGDEGVAETATAGEDVERRRRRPATNTSILLRPPPAGPPGTTARGRLALPKAPPLPVLHRPRPPSKLHRKPFISGGKESCNPHPKYFARWWLVGRPFSAAESHGVAGSGSLSLSLSIAVQGKDVLDQGEMIGNARRGWSVAGPTRQCVHRPSAEKAAIATDTTCCI